jgi:hypothetical protein
MLTVKRRLEDERGVTLVLMVLLLVVLLGMAALVVDLGLVRSDRQRNKSVADVAVTAGLQAANIGSGSVGTYQGACAAQKYLQANHPELGSFSSVTWTDGTGATIVDPCTLPLAGPCNTTQGSTEARQTYAWFHGVTAGGVIVDIKAGYDATDMTSDATTYGFKGEDLHPTTDRGVADKYGCDQLAIIVKEPEDSRFGRVIGASALSSRIRSVGRVTIDTQTEDAVALLLLERSDCKALDINGTNTFVRVNGTDTRPGVVHSDSMGTGSCSGSSHVLQGDHLNGIVAKQAPSGTRRGIISIAALGGTSSSNAYDSTTNVVAEGSTPSVGGIKGRGPVDSRYLGTSTSGITGLRADATAAWGWSNPDITSNGYTRYTGGNCPPNTIASGVTKLWLDCNVTTTWTVPTTVTDIVIKGKIDLGGATVTLPNVRTLYIYGATGSNAKGIDLGSGGALLVNTKNITAAAAPHTTICDTRRASGADETTKVVVGNGQLNSGSTGLLRMCSSTLFMMDGTLPSTQGTAPGSNAFNGPMSVTGQGTLEWTAPNVNDTGPPTTAQLLNFEDLAFWSETSDSHSIGGTGASLTLKGIFFTPNANPFKINAGGAGITADAQFITRKLEVSGGGTLAMTADPNNSIPFSIISGYSLVR